MRRLSTSKLGPAQSPARNLSSQRRRTGSPLVRRPDWTAIYHYRPWSSTAFTCLTIFHPLGPTVPEGFELSTERRARERQELEQLACEREAELAMLKEEERRREEQREKEEIARMRQEQVSRLLSETKALPLVASREHLMCQLSNLLFSTGSQGSTHQTLQSCGAEEE